MTNQNKTRDSFIFYRSFFSATKHLNQVEKAQLFDAICSYALDNKTDELNGTASGMFELIKPQLDANRKRFENGCVKKQKISKTKAKPKQKISKTEANVNLNLNLNDNLECKSQLDSFCDDIAKSLKDIIEKKLNRKVSSNDWQKQIKLTIKDLAVRGEEKAKQDIIKCIEAIEDHFGKDYFPVIQSANSLREKFAKIENYLAKTPEAKKNNIEQEFYELVKNNKGGF
jgi:hypothetical protein